MEMAKALSGAIEMEKNGYDVYMSAAKKTRNKLGRATLEAIAAKELNHIAAIEEYIDKISEGSSDLKKALKEIDPKEKSDYVKPILDKLRGELEEKVKPDSDLEKAYKVAMGLEKASFDLYQKLFKESDNPEAKQFFQFLMNEENTHWELLRETLQYLNRPAQWFEEKERWIVEG